MAFDPNAATARYIDSLGPAALQKAHDYTVGKEWMLLWALLVAALVTWLIVRSGVLDRLEAQVRRAAAQPARIRRRRRLFRRLGDPDAAVDALRRLLPREEPTAGPASRSAIGSASSRCSTLISLHARRPVHDGRLLADAAYRATLVAVVRRADRRRLRVRAAAAPVLIEPLFNKYEPVPPGQVRDAVVAMARRAGIPPSKVYMYNGSRQSNNFTANAGGVGSTARVAISDVALKNASLDEVRAVTGHEIGHYV